MAHLIFDSFHVTYVCVLMFISKNMKGRGNQTSKRDESSGVRSMTILNRWEEALLLWKQVYADTLPEVQSRVIPQLAEFLVIPPSKRKHWRVSNRIKLWSHRCFFWKGATTGVGASKGFIAQRRVLSSSRPGAVCQSRSEYTLHWLEHLEVCSSLIIIWWQKSAGKKPGDTQFLSNGRR